MRSDLPSVVLSCPGISLCTPSFHFRFQPSIMRLGFIFISGDRCSVYSVRACVRARLRKRKRRVRSVECEEQLLVHNVSWPDRTGSFLRCLDIDSMENVVHGHDLR